MLNAKEATGLTVKANNKEQMDLIERKIRIAANEGRYEVEIRGTLSNAVDVHLQKLGFTVECYTNSFRIKWPAC